MQFKYMTSGVLISMNMKIMALWVPSRFAGRYSHPEEGCRRLKMLLYHYQTTECSAKFEIPQHCC
jgi:hypothetical protein